MNKLMHIIRIVTVPPVFALITLTELLILRPKFVGGLPFYLLGIFCLSALPLLAYPLQRFFKKYKDRGREGQRELAIIFSAIGYLLSVVPAFVFHAPRELKMLFAEYLLCGISVFISGKVFKKKASGHACGVTGPVAMLIYLGLYIPALVGALLVVPVYISSVKTRRHTPGELILGSVIPVAMLAIVHVVFLAI